MATRQLFCSFCARSRRQIKKLVAGPNDVYICDSCVNECVEILRGSADKDLLVSKDKIRNLPTPRSIKEFLDQYVIGQTDAKEKLAVAVCNHYKRLAHPVIDDVEIDKSILGLIGPSGCGKCCDSTTRFRLRVPSALAERMRR
jgi:ATP-dependent Clp protease ATP-binding subunit ClpX